MPRKSVVALYEPWLSVSRVRPDSHVSGVGLYGAERGQVDKLSK
ncbi:MAG: hypothetical protein R8J94_21945 [Acidimicrobiia bacterium]|nr:hypothetical protein [Acidimicrobiia bacterium]